MKRGMLWLDNDPKTDLKTKIEKAADYYAKKYGTRPDLCFVHPSMTANGIAQVSGIEIRIRRVIMPHHFWIGVNTDSEQ